MTTAVSPAAPNPLHRARVAGVIAALVVYAVLVTVLLILSSAIFGSISRATFGGAALLWAIYLFPALVAPAAGALFNAIVYGPIGRKAAYWPNLGLVVLSTVIAVAWLLIAGGFWNAILALVQFAGGMVAWYVLHRAAHRKPARPA